MTTLTLTQKQLTLLIARRYLSMHKPRTRDCYRSDLKGYLRWCLGRGLVPLEVVRADIEDYKQHLVKKKLKPSTINRYLNSVSGFYNVAEMDEVIAKNPARFVKRLKDSSATASTTLGLSYLEFADLLRAAQLKGSREHALVLLMGMLGLRVSEAANVKVEDFSDQRGHRVLSIVGKGDKPAIIPLPPPVAWSLEAVIGDRKFGYLLFTNWNTPMNRRCATRLLKQLCLSIGITKRITPHSLRHTFVTQLLDAEVPLRDVQIAARHASPAMTIRYDRNRDQLDKHANYQLASRMAGAVVR